MFQKDLRFSYVLIVLSYMVCQGDFTKYQCERATANNVCEILDDAPARSKLYRNLHSKVVTLRDIAYEPACNILSPDSMQSKLVEAAILKSEVSEYFEISKTTDSSSLNTFSISLRRKIDREDLCKLYKTCCKSCPVCQLGFTIKFQAKKTEIYSDIEIDAPVFSPIVIELVDRNDHTPRFPFIHHVIMVRESTKVNSKISLPTAVDRDSSDFDISRYELRSEKDSPFELVHKQSPYESNSLFLKVVKALDWERESSYKLTLMAIDKGNPARTGSLTLTINIKDDNDNHPVFKNRNYQVQIKESLEVNAIVATVEAEDPDEGENGEVIYSITNMASNSKILRYFQIDMQKGDITLSNRLDYEQADQRVFVIHVNARDKAGHATQDQATVTVHVLDVNDTPPQISVEKVGSQPETLSKDKPRLRKKYITHAFVKDPDTGQGGVVYCTLKGTTKFCLEEGQKTKTYSLYKIFLNSSLDYEETPIEKFDIFCKDNGNPSLSQTTSIDIRVKDLNDNAPIFTKKSYQFFVPENNAMNFLIGQVKATDLDKESNGQIRYNIREEDAIHFIIGVNDGRIRSKQQFDRESRDKYFLEVKAHDLGSPSLTVSVSVTIIVRDQNDNPPKFVNFHDTGTYVFRIKENQPKLTKLGFVKATDADIGENAELFYEIITISKQPRSPLAVDRVSGELTLVDSVDREEKACYDVIIKVSDKGRNKRLTATTTLSLIIEDENDETPQILFPNFRNNTIRLSYLEHVGFNILKVRAMDKDLGDNSQLTYEIMSTNQQSLFRLDPQTGELLIDRELTSSDVGQYSLKIKVSDNGKHPLSSSVSFFVYVDTSRPRYSPGDQMPRKRSEVSSFQSGWILIVIVALICAIILVLLSMTIYLCGKKGILPLENLQFTGSNRCPKFKLCCLSEPFSAKDTSKRYRGETWKNTDAKFEQEKEASTALIEHALRDGQYQAD